MSAPDVEFVREIRIWLSEFDRGFQFIPEELIDAGNLVFARITLRGRGRASGVESEQRVFHLCEVRDGKAYRCRVFVSEDEARKAAGLEHGRWA